MVFHVGTGMAEGTGQGLESLAYVYDDGTEIFPYVPGTVIIKLVDSKYDA